MSPSDDRHRELLAKRRQLQARRERDACRATVAHELAVLDAAGTPYALIWSEQLRENWLGRRFPWEFGRVQWSAVPGSSRLPWLDHASRDSGFLAALDVLVGQSEAPLWLMWGNALKPGLRLSAEAIRRHATELLDADFDTWVCSEAGDWLLECYHEGEIAFGRLPSRPPSSSSGSGVA